MKTFKLEAKILSQNKIKDSYWHCELSSAKVAKHVLPGQFINIRMSDKCDPLLRRPISVHGVKGERIEILYEVVGKATEILSRKKAGELLDIIGPLGNGFKRKAAKEQIIVSGGMGVAPLVFLTQRLGGAKTTALIGARTKSQLLCVNDFKKLGCSVRAATDDGSAGFKGKVSDLLIELLRKPKTENRARNIYACGPRAMLKAISDISIKYAVPAQVSLEEHMSCGIGACLGCMVKTKEGLKRVCKEGPVFNAQDLIW